jgi:hypothetical protein
MTHKERTLMDEIQIARFWAKVDRRGADECWPWKRGVDKNGYGKTYANGKHVRAHRVSWQLARGRSADELSVCHTCDNPVCCNPTHLFLGTNAENMRDKIAKGRARYECGESHHAAKLTAADVAAIRRRLAAGERGSMLAAEFSVARSAISRIKHRGRWSASPSPSATCTQESALTGSSEN